MIGNGHGRVSPAVHRRFPLARWSPVSAAIQPAIAASHPPTGYIEIKEMLIISKTRDGGLGVTRSRTDMRLFDGQAAVAGSPVTPGVGCQRAALRPRHPGPGRLGPGEDRP